MLDMHDAAEGLTTHHLPAGIKVEARISHTIYDTAEIYTNNGNKPPTSLKQLQAAAAKCGPPPEPVADPPDKLPGVPKGAEGTGEKEAAVPSLKDLGYTQTPTTPFHVSSPVESWGKL